VASISADTIPLATQAGAGESAAAAYQVLLRPEQIALRGRQGNCPLRPGMEASADVVTRRTTVLMFLLNKLRLSA